MGRRKVVCNIWSHALKFGWVRHPLPMSRRKFVCNIWSNALGFGLVSLFSLANRQEKSRLQGMESCTRVWVSKPFPLLMDKRNFVCNIWSNALAFGWVRLPHF